MTRVIVLCGEEGKCQSLQASLALKGVQVETYPPSAALSLTWLSPQLPAMVILDMQIATLQGWEILKLLKENPVMCEIPVLFCNLEEEQGAVIEMEYLMKPVGAATLAETISRLGLSQADGIPRRILLVDDDPGTLELHTRMLNAHLAAFQILKAENGYTALQILQQQPPDLVLLDLMMPEIDGFQVLEKMHAEDALRNIPVIVLTAQALTAEDMARLNRSVASVLNKGLFTKEEILAHIITSLERTKLLSSDAQRLVRKVIAYIHQNYTQPIDRKTLAAYASVSESYLSRCFHTETGVSLITYLNRWRINRSKALLSESDHTITEIALEVGFSDSNYFTRLFRQENGLTPSQYRKTPS